MFCYKVVLRIFSIFKYKHPINIFQMLGFGSTNHQVNLSMYKLVLVIGLIIWDMEMSP